MTNPARLSIHRGLSTAPWVLTDSGEEFVLAGEGSRITIGDVAHALARICRWTGHTEVFYSVADHSIRVAEYVLRRTEDETDAERARQALWGLLHDASEAYLGDVSAPLKAQLRLMGSTAYDDLERDVMSRVADWLGLVGPEPEIVREADRVMCSTEMRDLMRGQQARFFEGRPKPLPERIVPMPIPYAEEAFIAFYAQLREGQPARRIIVPN